MNDKKSLTSIIAILLLLIVGVTSVLIFKTFYTNFQSSKFSNMEKTNTNKMEITYLNPKNVLYISNGNSVPVNFTNIKVGSKFCSINGTLNPHSITKISIANCTNGMEPNPKDIAVFTEYGIFNKMLMLKPVSFTPTSINSGNFTGYAYGEQFGYISFNGTGYQVTMKNNKLSGYAYSENFGFISFNGTNYNVTNINGVFVGYAYGENVGYIDFNNSPIYNTTFNGTNLNGNAYSENLGYISFNNTIYNISIN